MTKIIDMKKYQKRGKIDRILLYCVDNKMETRYITAEFCEKNELLIKLVHYNNIDSYDRLDYLYIFSKKESNKLVKFFAENKSDFLYELKAKFNTASACSDLIHFADIHNIKYKFDDLSDNIYSSFLELDDIFLPDNKLYYSKDNLFIPNLYIPPRNGVTKIYTPEGYLYLEISYKNGLKDGMTKCYFENTKIVDWKQNYTKNKLNGISRSYFKNGNLRVTETFVNGVKEGIEGTYNQEGFLEYSEMFKNNAKNGKSIKFYPNGQIEKEAYFKNGKQDGETKWYYDTGELKLVAYWKNDKCDGERITYHKNGQIKAISTYKNGSCISDEYQYYEDGTLEAIIPARDTGIELVYYPNGKLKSERKYNKGKKCGNGKYYYDNGKIEADYNYKNDKRHGICKEYHYNGKIRSECEYKNGKKHGIEKRYYNNGQLSYERHYKNGLRDSWSISYEEKTGEIQYKIFFRKGKVVDFYGIDGITGVKGLKIE